MRVETPPHTPPFENSRSRPERRTCFPDGASEVSAGPSTAPEALLHPGIHEGATATTAAMRVCLLSLIHVTYDTPLIRVC
jgi:hypothetical protein